MVWAWCGSENLHDTVQACVIQLLSPIMSLPLLSMFGLQSPSSAPVQSSAMFVKTEQAAPALAASSIVAHAPKEAIKMYSPEYYQACAMGG